MTLKGGLGWIGRCFTCEKDLEKLIHASYLPYVGWVLPIRAALNESRSLADRDSNWKSSDLSDLAFSIETRFGVLPQIQRQILDSAERLIGELRSAKNLAPYIERFAFSFVGREDLGRAATEAEHFLGEARALFYNLADFYRGFLQHYFEETASEIDSYKHLARLSKGSEAWAWRLKELRDDVLHHRAPWPVFRILSESPLDVELLFTLNWRPHSSAKKEAKDTFTLSELHELHQCLTECAAILREQLVKGVKSLERVP